MNRLKISWGTNRQSELRGVVSHPCVSRPGRRLDQVRGDHQLPRIIKPRSRRKPTFIYHQVDALSCCRNHQVRMDCALIIIPFCRYKWNAIAGRYWGSNLKNINTSVDNDKKTKELDDSESSTVGSRTSSLKKFYKMFSNSFLRHFQYPFNF